MGRCKNHDKSTIPTHHKNNPSDLKGAKKEIRHGCGSAGSVSASLKGYMPQNGEYEWAGEGNKCHYSSKHTGREISCTWGCIGTTGKCSISGKRGLYRRKSYNADKKKCCEGKANSNHLIGNLTCDPDARTPTSSLCLPYTKARCKASNKNVINKNIFTQDYCTDYCGISDNSDWCKSQKTTICNREGVLKTDSKCRAWCKQNQPNCETGIKSFCDEKDNIFKEDVCISWCNANEQDCLSKKTKYCNDKDKISTNQTCLEYCRSNPGNCKSGIQDYCEIDNNIFNKSLCTSFCAIETNKAWCNNVKSTYCNTDAGKVNAEGCKEFCMSQDGFGHCDTSFEAHCGLDKSKQKELQDPRCSCLNSKVSEYNPLCVDTKCTDTGYATSSMLESKGNSCNITDCSQYVSLKDNIAEGTFTANQDFLQQCGATINQYVAPTDVDPNTSKNDDTGEDDPIPDNNDTNEDESTPDTNDNTSGENDEPEPDNNDDTNTNQEDNNDNTSGENDQVEDPPSDNSNKTLDPPKTNKLAVEPTKKIETGTSATEDDPYKGLKIFGWICLVLSIIIIIIIIIKFVSNKRSQSEDIRD